MNSELELEFVSVMTTYQPTWEMLTSSSVLLALLPPILISGAMLWYSRRRWKKRREQEPLQRPLVSGCTVLFFPDTATALSLSDSPSANDCVDRGSLSVLIETLQCAKKSLDVCVFAFSCKELGDVLINAHSNGVFVRVITDNEQSVVSGSQIERLRKKGIQVRTDKASYFMHHKFALVDEETLINGSLNWTLQGVCGNQENVVIATTPDTVGPFNRHFERLWEFYNPEKLFD